MDGGWPAFVFIASLLLGGCSSAPKPISQETQAPISARDPESRTAEWFESHRHRPPLLRAFLQRMPKGADLHTHLGGAVYAETYIAWATEADHCLDTGSMTITQGPCDPDHAKPPLSEAVRSLGAYAALVDALSTRHTEGNAHDQFFSTFGRFRGIGDNGGKVAEILARAQSQHIHYLEIMLSLGKKETSEMGERVGLHHELATTREELLEEGLIQVVERARKGLDDMDSSISETLDCDEKTPGAACSVDFRYIQSTNRTLSPAQVFSGMLFSFLLADTDPRVVGINLVGPEDHPVALRDYGLHMEMLAFLGQVYPNVNISLHAGELTLGQVPPEHLRFHIRMAVEKAGAQRIGHGTDLAYETNAVDLLAELARRQVLLEISLNSSARILSVHGDEHPLQAYLEAGVPVALVTDDEGVLRTDLSHEFFRASTTYNLGYRCLKTMARNGLAFSFLAGGSLWKSTSPPVLAAPCANDEPGSLSLSPPCSELLVASERARAQWQLEKDFVEFESLPWLDPAYPASCDLSPSCTQ